MFKMIAAKLYELATKNYLKFDTCLEKNGQVQEETILKPEGADSSKSCVANLHYATIVCTNFQKNCSKIVGGACDINLPVFRTQIH